MRILITGRGRSGTTALFFMLKKALPKDTKYVFERPEYHTSTDRPTDNILVKKLMGGKEIFSLEEKRWSENRLNYSQFDCFEKKILIVRDPRDREISELLFWVWNLATVRDEKKVSEWIKLLKKKERHPQKVSVTELIQSRDALLEAEGMIIEHLRLENIKSYLDRCMQFHECYPDYFLFHYEDMVKGNLKPLEEYLGLTLSREINVGKNFAFVVRAKGMGDWKNWYLKEDVRLFRPIFGEYMKRYGYPDDWTINALPVIKKEHATAYAKKLRKKKLKNLRKERIQLHNSMKDKLKKQKNPLYLFMHVPKCGGSTFVRHIKNNFKEEEILNLYPIQEVHIKVPGYEHLKGSGEVKNYLQLLEDAKKDNIKVIYGHNVFYGTHEYFSKPSRYVTFLRHPVARILSDYNMGLYLFDLFKKGLINDDHPNWTMLNSRYLIDSSGKMRPFEEWIDLARTSVNNMVFFFNALKSSDRQSLKNVTREHLENAKKLLEKFYFVGITENFNEDAAFLYGKLKIQKFCENQNVAPKYYLQKNDKKMTDLIISKNQLDTELYEHAKKLNREFKKQNKYFYFLATYMKWKRAMSDRSGKTIKDRMNSDRSLSSESHQEDSYRLETSECREGLKKYCTGYGLDLGYGGDPIVPSAITVDLSIPYVRTGTHPLNPGGDARDLYWFRSNTLDYVYSSHILENFEDTEAVLREWLRVIKPGGYLSLFCSDEQVYRKHCQETGQSYNSTHKIENFSLYHVKHILEGFHGIEIIHENPLVDIYNFELVIRKISATHVLAEKNRANHRYREELKTAYDELEAAHRELETIHSSHGWKVLMCYYRLRDKIFPLNTKRRVCAKILWKIINKTRSILSKGCIRKMFFGNKMHNFHNEEETYELSNKELNLRECRNLPLVMESKPTLVYAEVSTYCNMNCTMCGRTVHGMSASNEGFMKQEVFEKLADVFTRGGTLAMFGWGEPLLHPQFIYFLRLAKQQGMKVSFNTNGKALTKDIARAMVEYGQDSVTFSCSAGTAETYEEIHRGGKWKQLWGNIAGLLNAKKLYGSGPDAKPAIYLEFVSQTGNIKELPLLVERAMRWKLPGILVADLVAHSDEFENHRTNTPETLPLAEKYYEKAVRIREKLRNVNPEFNLILPSLYNPLTKKFTAESETKVISELSLKLEQNFRGIEKKKMCLEPWQTFYVKFDGSVSPCCIRKRDLGNLNKQGALEIWNGPEFQKFRARMRSDKKPFECTRCHLFPGPRRYDPALDNAERYEPL